MPRNSYLVLQTATSYWSVVGWGKMWQPHVLQVEVVESAVGLFFTFVVRERDSELKEAGENTHMVKTIIHVVSRDLLYLW